MEKILKKASVITNFDKKENKIYADIIKSILEKEGCECVFESHNRERYSHDVDCYIVLGGDGSILHVANDCSAFDIPVIAINLGHLGYMAELDRNEGELIRDIIHGNFFIEKRMMLEVSITKNGETVFDPYPALNDAVISNGTISKMVDIELKCDERFVGRYHADGLICSTPTGSTAYSLSAGGPVIDPSLECICVTPVSPHSLKARPMIFSSDCFLEIKKIADIGGEVYLTLDGEINRIIEDGETIRVSKSNRYVKLIRFKKNRFFDVLASKMSD